MDVVKTLSMWGIICEGGLVGGIWGKPVVFFQSVANMAESRCSGVSTTPLQLVPCFSEGSPLKLVTRGLDICGSRYDGDGWDYLIISY